MTRDRLLRGSSRGVQGRRRFARVKGAYNEQIDGGVARDPRFVRPANCCLAAAAGSQETRRKAAQVCTMDYTCRWVPPG